MAALAEFDRIQNHMPHERRHSANLPRLSRVRHLPPISAVNPELDPFDAAELAPSVSGDVDRAIGVVNAQQVVLEAHIH